MGSIDHAIEKSEDRKIGGRKMKRDSNQERQETEPRMPRISRMKISQIGERKIVPSEKRESSNHERHALLSEKRARNKKRRKTGRNEHKSALITANQIREDQCRFVFFSFVRFRVFRVCRG
jgi:hypothetical protein